MMSEQFKQFLACCFSLERNGKICFESFNSTSTVIPEFVVQTWVYLTSEFSLFDWCANYFSNLGVCQFIRKGCLEYGSYKLCNGNAIWPNRSEQLCISAFSISFIKVQFVCYCCLSPNKLHAEELTFFTFLLMQAWNQTWFQTKQLGPRLERM